MSDNRKDNNNFQQKTHELAEKMQKLGCALTVYLTIPIIFIAVFGVPGLIISGFIIIIYIFSRKKPQEISKNTSDFSKEKVISNAKKKSNYNNGTKNNKFGTSFYNNKAIILDTETTGLSQNDEIIELTFIFN